jgi:hypothetical protein
MPPVAIITQLYVNKLPKETDVDAFSRKGPCTKSGVRTFASGKKRCGMSFRSRDARRPLFSSNFEPSLLRLLLLLLLIRLLLLLLAWPSPLPSSRFAAGNFPPSVPSFVPTGSVPTLDAFFPWSSTSVHGERSSPCRSTRSTADAAPAWGKETRRRSARPAKK